MQAGGCHPPSAGVPSGHPAAAPPPLTKQRGGGGAGGGGGCPFLVADELGLRVAALTAERNVELLEAQCRQYRPELAVLTDEAAAEELKVRLADMNIRVLAGAEALCEAAALPEADTVVVAGCGFAAPPPTPPGPRNERYMN